MRKYRTVSGDTWDLIAYREYGEYGGEKLTSELICANPEYADTVIFSAGAELVIPEAYVPVSRMLPPWM
ncbi:MAG: tail protein X [Synergistaceae bacterium]|nr:tail protein X [Synergistaceae bacterium]